MTEFRAVGRIRRGDAPPALVGWLDDTAYLLEGDLFSAPTAGAQVAVDEGDLLTPHIPGKIMAAAVNYVSHAIKRDPPTKPELFYKPVTSLVGPGDQVVFPPDADIVEAEGELVLVIGSRTKNASVEEAQKAILGYTCGFDISARNFQRADRHFWRAKGSDTFSPVGPRIALGAPAPGVRLVTRINGEVKQETTVGEMIFSPAELVSFASHYVTLEPGDLFYTGTPGVPPGIVSGDSLEVEIDGPGVLRATVA